MKKGATCTYFNTKVVLISSLKYLGLDLIMRNLNRVSCFDGHYFTTIRALEIAATSTGTNRLRFCDNCFAYWYSLSTDIQHHI